MDIHGDETGRPLMVVRWSIPSRRRSPADENAAEELAESLMDLIPPVADAEILGFDDAEERIDIVIWGEGTDEEIDVIYRAIAPLFRRYGCPPGSCIIRYYGGGAWEFISDEV